jgi:hypothetical protein
MRSFNLRQVKLRPGEEHREEIELELEPFELGGERYLPVPGTLCRRCSRSRRRRAAWSSTCASPPGSTGPVIAASGTPCSRFRSTPANTRRRRTRRASRSCAWPTWTTTTSTRDVGARRNRPRAPRQDPLPHRLRGALPGLRQEPERRAARAPGGDRRQPLVGPGELARAALATLRRSHGRPQEKNLESTERQAPRAAQDRVAAAEPLPAVRPAQAAPSSLPDVRDLPRPRDRAAPHARPVAQ